ncbi:hypothetical protein EDD22DRAFT_825457 [Suillus occidentalis]|nr:hypothetical protein EDD22DRAFT_825457 [Suillus occidentalis]
MQSFFGEAGAGKIFLVNLIAGTNTAATSSDAGGCTSAINEHEILAGLDEDPRGTFPDKQARRMLKKLVRLIESIKRSSAIIMGDGFRAPIHSL